MSTLTGRSARSIYTRINIILSFDNGVKSGGREDETIFFSATEGARAASFGRLSDGDPVTRARRCAVPNTLGSARPPRHAAPDPRAILYFGTIKMLCTPRGAAATAAVGDGHPRSHHILFHTAAAATTMYIGVSRNILYIYIGIWVYVRTICRHAPAGRCPVRNACCTDEI
jgi:hypothetical protein